MYYLSHKKLTKIEENLSFVTYNLATIVILVLWFHKDIIVFVSFWYTTIEFAIKLERFKTTERIKRKIFRTKKTFRGERAHSQGLVRYLSVMTFLIVFFLSCYDKETKRQYLMISRGQFSPTQQSSQIKTIFGIGETENKDFVHFLKRNSEDIVGMFRIGANYHSQIIGGKKALTRAEYTSDPFDTSSTSPQVSEAGKGHKENREEGTVLSKKEQKGLKMKKIQTGISQGNFFQKKYFFINLLGSCFDVFEDNISGYVGLDIMEISGGDNIGLFYFKKH